MIFTHIENISDTYTVAFICFLVCWSIYIY